MLKSMTKSAKVLLMGALVSWVMYAADVVAVQDEIMVYTDETNEPGKFGLEQHFNYSVQGAQTTAYPGQMPPHHVLQATPELSYGITKNLEAGLYLPVAFAPDGNSYLNAVRLRLKYIAHDLRNEKIYYGVSVEASRDSIRTSESSVVAEIRPIVGYHGTEWLASFNPILNIGLAANVSHQPQFEPAVKLSRRVDEVTYAGFEYYGEYGPFNQLLPSDQCAHSLYAVLDVETHGMDVNMGVGRGFVNATDAWVVKAIIALPL